MRNILVPLITATVILSGCSSRPRSLEPVTASAMSAEQRGGYDQRLLYCRQQVAGMMDKSGRLASAAGGAAIGAGATAAATAAAAGTYASYGAAAAALGAVMLVAPVGLVAGAVGIAKIKRAKKEKAIKAVMGQCLAEGGYPVSQWRAMSRKEAKALADQLEALERQAGQAKP